MSETRWPPCPDGWEPRMPSQEERPAGLHRKYDIRKANGAAVAADATYFVLRLDDGCRDKGHLAACRSAVLTYADAIEDHIPGLASDIRAAWGPALPATTTPGLWWYTDGMGRNVARICADGDALVAQVMGVAGAVPVAEMDVEWLGPVEGEG